MGAPTGAAVLQLHKDTILYLCYSTLETPIDPRAFYTYFKKAEGKTHIKSASDSQHVGSGGPQF